MAYKKYSKKSKKSYVRKARPRNSRPGNKYGDKKKKVWKKHMSAQPMPFFKVVATTPKEAKYIHQYGNYNIPNVAKTYQLYDYLVAPRDSTVQPGAAACWYWSTSSPANSLEDMFTGTGNPEVPGYLTLKAMYTQYVPIGWKCSHTYNIAYKPGTTTLVQSGKYLLVGGFAATATNPFLTQAGLTDPRFAEQSFRGMLQFYQGRMKIINVNTAENQVTPNTFKIGSATSLNRMVGKTIWDPWASDFAALSANNPVSPIYFHSVLMYLSTNSPLVQCQTDTRTQVKSMWHLPLINVDAV